MDTINFDQMLFKPVEDTPFTINEFTPLISATYYLNSEGKTNLPYNVEFINTDHCRISLDVSGYPDASLDIEFGACSISVRGKPANNKESTLLYRGIANDAFECIFYLADYVEVADARKVDGLLVLHLVRDHSNAVDSLTVPDQDGSNKALDHLQQIEVKHAA